MEQIMSARSLRSRRPRTARPATSPLRFASASAALADAPSMPAPPAAQRKPANDVLAGAVARAASQSTIHPLDTLKVECQARGKAVSASVARKLGKLVPPPGQQLDVFKAAKIFSAGVGKLYRGVFSAASGAGLALGAYFAFYGVAMNVLSSSGSDMPVGARAFVAGGVAATGSSVVKVPIAVCLRSVQAGVYPNMLSAATSICEAVGPRGLFTGYWPTLCEDIPDMAFKFAAFETLRSIHSGLTGRKASVQEDFAMGAAAGAFAAAATTPLDVVKTTMMCSAASRPSLVPAVQAVVRSGGPGALFTGVGPRAMSNGINSAVFFCFFEALRGIMEKRKARGLAPGGVADPAGC